MMFVRRFCFVSSWLSSLREHATESTHPAPERGASANSLDGLASSCVRVLGT